DSGNDSSDNSTHVAVADSGNDNSDNSTHVAVADSGNDNSDNSVSLTVADSGNTAQANTSNWFGDGAQVATSTLASHVTGVTVNNATALGATTADNRLTNSGNSFQNLAGLQALNQNTGTGASQNASVTTSDSTGDVSF